MASLRGCLIFADAMYGIPAGCLIFADANYGALRGLPDFRERQLWRPYGESAVFADAMNGVRAGVA